MGVGLEQYSASQMTYDLRRLRRKGIICHVSGSQRCYLTLYGWKLARLYANSLIPETDTDCASGLNQPMIRIDESQTINSVSNWRI